ncbi:MAG: hypothetical protein H0U27_02620 [Nitrosopumilus sp.]|nr:hypothetical protein [Nitrosopumilus sp.]
MIVGGDGFKKSHFNHEERRHLIHVTMKLGNLIPTLFSKIENHLVLGLLEGKESRESVSKMYETVMVQLKKLVENGIELNGVKHHVNVSFTGDMKWQWLLLGMSEHNIHGKICWRCKFDNKIDSYLKSCEERTINDLYNDVGIGGSNMMTEPVTKEFETSAYKMDIHHAWLAFLRSFCRACVTIAEKKDVEVLNRTKKKVKEHEKTINKVNKILRENDITAHFSSDEESVSFIGKHFNPILNLADEIGKILDFSENQLKIVKDLQKLLNIGNDYNMNEKNNNVDDSDRQFFIENIEITLEAYVSLFKLR